MMVRTTGADEFFGTFPNANTVYGSWAFFDVTPAGDSLVRCFIGYDERMRPKAGLIAGLRNGVWQAPYSAPFAEIMYNEAPSIETFYDFVNELTTMLGAPLHITTAPDFYGKGTGAEIQATLGNLARKCIFDYNYIYRCDTFGAYRESLPHSARKNLARAMGAGFTFEKTDDIDRAYAVIRANRESRGHPLAMSLERVRATVAVVPADFFLLTLDGADVAAAMVYHVADGIAQVIYWGDAPGYSEHRPMNLIAYEVFGHYSRLGYRIVDVGPSSSDGVPSPGLCRFKQSVGCVATLKPTYIL